MKCFFIPGRKWQLSLSEIKSVAQSLGIRYVELSHSEKVFLFDVMLDENALSLLFSRLGGSIKVGVMIDEPFEYLRAQFVDHERSKELKIPFSASFYSETLSNREKVSAKMKLGMKLKRWLKDYGYRARFVAKTTEPITSSVLLSTNKVLTDGFELCLLSHPKNGDTLWGVTLAIQDYAGFAERDYGRPRVNKKKGMLPPKLARIMVNLAELPEKSCIWDPFCGSGTVLMETLLLGYSVIGTDIDQTSVDETKENLAWLCDTYWISHTQYQVNLHDIRDGVPVISEFDGIVTEPYLGPILRSAVSVERMESIVKEIQPLYEAIERITHKKSTVKKKRAVIVVPGFKTDQGWIDMDPSFESAPHIDDLTQKISSYPLQWDRPNSIIRRNLKIYAF